MRKLTIVLAMLMMATGAAAQTEITGFVDGAYFYDPAVEAGEFGLDQIEIDIIHRSSDKTSLRADIEYVKDGEDMVAQVEQGFMTYTTPCGHTFTFGKFNAPIGFELLDAPDMFQYSHALVFDYGLPTNLTGASFARELGAGVDIVAYMANGWDANTMAGKNTTFGGRLGYAKDRFAGGLSAISGKQDIETIGTTRTVIDVDLGYETSIWTFGGEFNMGTATVAGPAGDIDSEWMGFMGMGHADFNEWAGLTLRYDWFDDKDGWNFETVGGAVQQRQAFTICPTFVLDENCGALIELRFDRSNQDAFVDADGEATDMQTAVAFEMTYSW